MFYEGDSNSHNRFLIELTGLQCLDSDRRGLVPEPGPDLSEVALTQLFLEVER